MCRCSSIIFDNCRFCCAQIKEKFKDDLLIGTEHENKIIPACDTPSQNIFEILTDDEKIKMVLDDPKFGMFSLFKYHVKRGYKNEILKHKNAFYCSHTFSLLAGLPIIIFLIQWSIYIALVSYELSKDSRDVCPGDSGWEKKLIVFSVSMLYFVRSFFMWDNLTDRTRLNRMLPSTDVWVMFDTFQEYGFNFIVYLANLWIVFHNDSVQEMIMNCLAMEFLMNLDNEFEQMYFDFLPEIGVDIYDNLFVTYSDNKKKIEKRNKSCGFRCVRCTFFIPFKLLVISLLFFPFFCLFIAFYGFICK